MRGKNGKAAEARRSWADVERERDEARLRAEKAERELQRQAEQVGSERAAAARELAMLREAAAHAVAPIVENQQAQIDALRDERDGLVLKLAAWGKARNKYERALTVTLASNFPIGPVEAQTLIHQVWGAVLAHEEPGAVGYHEVTGSDPGRGSSASAVMRAVDKGRVTFEQGDTLAEVRTGRRRPSPQGDSAGTYGNLWTTEADIIAACDEAG